MTRARVFGVALVVAAAAVTPSSSGASAAGVSASVTPSPLSVTLTLSAAEVSTGEPVTAVVGVTNLGPRRLADVAAALLADPGGLALSGANPRSLGALSAGRVSRVSWRLCGRQAGVYVVLARATAEPYAADSAASLLRVRAGRRRCSG